MQVGLAISLVLHAALLGWALFTIQQTPELRVAEPDPIEIALIDPSEFLRLKKGALDVSELEAKAKEAPKPDQSVKEADKPKPVEAPEPPAAEPPPPVEAKPEPPKPEPPKPDPIAEKLAEPPPPGPTPEEQQKLADLAAKAEQERKAEEKRKADEAKKKAAEEKRKAEERKKRIEQARKDREQKQKKSDADRLAALLDKDPTKRGAPNAASAPTKPTDYTGRTAGANQGEDTVLSAREQDLLVSQLRSQIRDCWKLPGGGGGIDSTVVVLSWRLRPDGSLDGEPEVMNRQSDSIYQIAVEAAIRAVKSCSPFNLPPDKYGAWKFIDEWKFDPREML
ncbi:MAG: cell envelope integrity protein TolA [Hyphomicrobium sp.]